MPSGSALGVVFIMNIAMVWLSFYLPAGLVRSERTYFPFSPHGFLSVIHRVLGHILGVIFGRLSSIAFSQRGKPFFGKSRGWASQWCFLSRFNSPIPTTAVWACSAITVFLPCTNCVVRDYHAAHDRFGRLIAERM